MNFSSLLKHEAPQREKEEFLINVLKQQSQIPHSFLLKKIVEICVMNNYTSVIDFAKERTVDTTEYIWYGLRGSRIIPAKPFMAVFDEKLLYMTIKCSAIQTIERVITHKEIVTAINGTGGHIASRALFLAIKRGDSDILQVFLGVFDKLIQEKCLRINQAELIEVIQSKNSQMIEQVFKYYDITASLHDASNVKSTGNITAGQNNAVADQCDPLLNACIRVLSSCTTAPVGDMSYVRTIVTSCLKRYIHEMSFDFIAKHKIIILSVRIADMDTIKLVFEDGNVINFLKERPYWWGQCFIEALSSGKILLAEFLVKFVVTNIAEQAVRFDEKGIVIVLMHNNERFIDVFLKYMYICDETSEQQSLLPTRNIEHQGKTFQSYIADVKYVCSQIALFIHHNRNVFATRLFETFIRCAIKNRMFTTVNLLVDCINSRYHSSKGNVNELNLVFEAVLSKFSEDIQAHDVNRKLLLHRCLKLPDSSFFDLLLKYCHEKIDTTATDPCGNTIVFAAEQTHNRQLLRSLLQVLAPRIDPNMIHPKTKDTVFIRAAKDKRGLLSILFHSFSDRFNPNVQNATGNTALMYAVCNHSPDTVKKLVEHPLADVTIRNKYYQNVMDIATGDEDVGARTMKLIQVTFDKQTQLQELTSEHDLTFHIEKIQTIIKSPCIDRQTQAMFSQQLSVFADDLTRALRGNAIPSIGMKLEHRLKLQSKRVYLLDELDPNDAFLDHILQDKVINRDEMEKIRVQETRRERMTKFLDCLPCCGENAYDSFVKALRTTNKFYVADMLEPPGSAAPRDASVDHPASALVTTLVPDAKITADFILTES